MLLAVIMGCERPRKSDLSKRRSIRRLLLANCRRTMVFTRNSSGVVVRNEVVRHPGLRKTPEDFEFFHASVGRDRQEYAFLRARRDPADRQRPVAPPSPSTSATTTGSGPRSSSASRPCAAPGTTG